MKFRYYSLLVPVFCTLPTIIPPVQAQQFTPARTPEVSNRNEGIQTYKAIRAFQLDGNAVAVRNFKLIRDVVS